MPMDRKLDVPRVSGDIVSQLGSKLTMHLDYTDEDSYVLKKGVVTVNGPRNENSLTPWISSHLNTPSTSMWDYRASGTGVPSPVNPAFSVIHSFAFYGNMFADPSYSFNYLLCSRRNNMLGTVGTGVNVGWALTATLVSGAWRLGCMFDDYTVRSNELVDGQGSDPATVCGQVGLRWDPSATAGERLSLFINGVKCTKVDVVGTEPSAASTTAFDTNSGPIIGWWYGHSAGYSPYRKAAACHKQFGYWQRALSDSEFTSFYSGGITLSDTAVTTGYSPAAYWPFNEEADGVATGGTNQRVDIVGGKLMIPRIGQTAGNWLGIEKPAKTIWVAEKLTNKASTGGYISLHAGNSIEYRETDLTLEAPTYGSKQLRLNDMSGQRKAFLLDANLVDVVDHTDGVIMYCARYDAFGTTEGFDFEVLVDTGVPSGTPAYGLAGYGTYSGTRRMPMLRTESYLHVPRFGGAYLATDNSAPSLGVPYLNTILKIGGDYWFRRTNLVTGETEEDSPPFSAAAAGLGFWWPTTLANQGKSYQYVSMYGHTGAAGSVQYFGQCFLAKNVSYQQMLKLENYIKTHL